MKTRTMLLSVAFCLVAMTLSFAENPNIGTWKLNEAKSKFPAGATKNNTVVYEAAGDKIKVTVDGVDGDGKPIHNVWTGKLDGKDYPLTGDPTADTRSYKSVDERTTDLTNKKAGKPIATGQIVISPDGKSRTVTVSSLSKGKKLTYVAAYDKQ